MDITRIEAKISVTVNAGEFQSITASLRVSGDLTRGEDPVEAHAQLVTFIRTSLITSIQENHPEKVKRLIAGEERMTEATAQLGAAEPAKRGRKPGSTNKPKEAAAPAQTLAEAGGLDIGGLDKEDELDSIGLDEPPVTLEMVHAALTDLMKVGDKKVVLQIFSKYGINHLSQLPEDKYAACKADAERQLAELKKK